MSKKVLSRIFLYGAIAITLFLIVFFLEREPSESFVNGKLSFLIARGWALLIAVILSVLTYCGVKVAVGWQEIKLENKYLKDKRNDDLAAEGYNSFDIWMIEAPMMGWVIWWIFCFQVMVTFYVADWCKYGF